MCEGLVAKGCCFCDELRCAAGFLMLDLIVVLEPVVIVLVRMRR